MDSIWALTPSYLGPRIWVLGPFRDLEGTDPGMQARCDEEVDAEDV